jgi:GNAT superfamily N-acetyltransferase
MLEIRREPAGSPDARRLLEAMVREMLDLYAVEEMPTPAESDDLEPPAGGAFLVGREDGRPVAAGALKRLEPRVAEIKRMYVMPDARGRGHARRLLAALEDAARELGYERVRLDTGASQPHARALYESAGFEPIDDYNDNPLAAYWGEKVLA